MSAQSALKTKSPSAAARSGVLVTVKVGPDRAEYRVHQALLLESSEYFEKALSGRWSESEDGVELVGVECEIFDIFVDWLYTTRLPELWSHLARIKAYVLGDRILAEAFQKDVRAVLVKECANQARVPWYEMTIIAFANLPSKDIVLALLVDAHCNRWTTVWDKPKELERRAQLPHDFLLRVMIRHSHIHNQKFPGKLSPCDYHEHKSDEEREKCQDKDCA